MTRVITERVGGPYFDDLAVGDVVDPGPYAPAATLTDGLAAAHRAIVGDRLPLALSSELAIAVAGEPVAHPALVWDVAIGQSTAVTRRVVANLFYRGFVLRRLPAIGDTLRTRTEVVGLRQNRSRPTGLVALRVTTADQRDRTVLDFWRCAMLPLSAADVRTGHADDLDAIGVAPDDVARAVAGWDLTPLAGAKVPRAGDVLDPGGGDVVSSAPELARLSLNVAAVHHDRRAGGGRRLVYGGHTVALALAQAARAVPSLVTVLAWESCDHTGPVTEGDTLSSTVQVSATEPAPGGGTLARLRSVVRAVGAGEAPDAEPREVLDWRFTGLLSA